MKFAVRIIKNTFYPVTYEPVLEKWIEHGKIGLVITEKGEEAFKLFKVNDEIMAHWEKFKPEPLKLIRVLTEDDLKTLAENKQLARAALLKCEEFANARKLDMSLTQARYTFDRKKITFYYTAPQRVDFRELLKDLTQEFKRVRIDLRHIGARDETAVLEGCGICGQQLCCCRFLRKFENVNSKLAKDQGIPLTPSKITGCCGRLLCCLNYEHGFYKETTKKLLPIGTSVKTPDGLGKVVSLNYFDLKINVKFEDGKIIEYKKEVLKPVDEVVNVEITTDTAYADDSGIDIKSLDNDRNSSTGNV
ncbi:stage 0 sporulation protein [bacterium]|nr:stage 0 sporulation protein [bacterium]